MMAYNEKATLTNNKLSPAAKIDLIASGNKE